MICLNGMKSDGVKRGMSTGEVVIPTWNSDIMCSNVKNSEVVQVRGRVGPVSSEYGHECDDFLPSPVDHGNIHTIVKSQAGQFDSFKFDNAIQKDGSDINSSLMCYYDDQSYNVFHNHHGSVKNDFSLQVWRPKCVYVPRKMNGKIGFKEGQRISEFQHWGKYATHYQKIFHM